MKNPRITDVKVIRESNLVEFEERVMKFIQMGYTPWGQMSIDEMVFFNLMMVKYEEIDEK